MHEIWQLSSSIRLSARLYCFKSMTANILRLLAMLHLQTLNQSSLKIHCQNSVDIQIVCGGAHSTRYTENLGELQARRKRINFKNTKNVNKLNFKLTKFEITRHNFLFLIIYMCINRNEYLDKCNYSMNERQQLPQQNRGCVPCLMLSLNSHCTSFFPR